MKINSKKLMEIIEEFRENYGYVEEDMNDDDEEMVENLFFDNEDWNEVEEYIKTEKNSANKYMSNKNKRIMILGNAVRLKKGLEEVNEELEKANLEKVYIRHFNELILYKCFKNNEVNASYLVGPDEYFKIKKECNLFRETHQEELSKFDKLNTFSGRITLRKLKEYIENNSKIDLHMNMFTRSITADIKDRIDLKDPRSYSEEELVSSIIALGDEDTLTSLTERCEKTRYYFVKYLILFIEAHINEFIEMLKEMSNSTITVWLDNIKNSVDEYLPWSIKYMAHIGLDYKDDDYELFLDKDEDIEKYQFKTARIMELLSRIVFFEATPLDEINVSPMFKTKSGKLRSWSLIRNIGYIFEVEEGVVIDKKNSDYMKKQRERKGEIEKLTVDAFLDFPINIKTLSCLLFERSKGMNEGFDESDNLKDRLSRMIQGKIDISRDVFLYSLMVINQTIKHTNYKIPERLELGNVSRINKLLDNCGFKMMSGKCFIDYLVKKSLKFSASEYVFTVVELFNISRDMVGEDAIINIENDDRTTIESGVDKQVAKKK